MGTQSKATGFISFLSTLEGMLPPDDFARFLAAVPAETKVLVDKPPLAMSWIDDDHFNALFKALDDSVARGNFAIFAEAGRQQMHRDMTTIYKLLMHLATPQMVIRKASTLYSTYTKNGSMIAKELGPRACVVTITNGDGIMPQTWIYHRGTIMGVLECAGVKAPKVEVVKGGGHEAYCEYHVSW